MARITCERSTREAIFEHVPEAETDEILFRYVVYALWTTWTDRETSRRVIDYRVLSWIGHHRFETAIAVIRYLEARLPNLRWTPHIPNRRARLIEDDGLPDELREAVEQDLETSPSEYEDRVYVLSGKAYKTHQSPAAARNELEEKAAEHRHSAPSLTSQYIWERMNDRPARTLSCITDHVGRARRMLQAMDLDAENEEELRRYYRRVLRQIEDQHKPFYQFSRGGRTDRIFPLNDSVLNLPKRLRKTLCQDFYEIDLKSAHLLIAAWLWDAEEALEKLVDEDYSIWEDLMAHCKPLFEAQGLEVPEKGDELYATVKAALKIAVYSTVYGMPAPSIQAELTKELKDVLGPSVGAHIRSHPIIETLLEKRDEKLAEMEVGDVLHGPTGIRIEVEQGLEDQGDGVDPKSAMATLCQSYEQALMRVILELEADRDEKSSNRFRVGLWLHDGAYAKMRSVRARTKDLNRRLRERCKELAEYAGKNSPLPAFFEVERVEAPEIPETSTSQRDNQSCSRTEATTAPCATRSEAVSNSPSSEETGILGLPKSKINGPEEKSAGRAASRSREESTSTAGAPLIRGACHAPDVPVIATNRSGGVTIDATDVEYVALAWVDGDKIHRRFADPTCGVYLLTAVQHGPEYVATYEVRVGDKSYFLRIGPLGDVKQVPAEHLFRIA